MEISSVCNMSYQQPTEAKMLNKVKETFDSLENALESGDMSSAKAAMAQLLQNAPAPPNGDNNPMGAKMEALNKALESGDLAAAQSAYADIQTTMSQRPSFGRPSGPPPNGSDPSFETEISGSQSLLDEMA